MKEGFSDQEMERFRQLQQQTTPPAGLEDKIIEQLRSQQLIHKKTLGMKISSYRLVTILIAVSIIAYFIYYSMSTIQLDCEHCDCDPIPGWEQITSPNPVVLLGELHGTKEAPAFAARMVCQARKSDYPVSLFLELNKTEQGMVDQYLASDGSAIAKGKLLQSGSWGRDYQDGRNSAAMFDLIEYIRKLKQAGHAVELVLMDLESAPDRDIEMANNILQTIEKDSSRFFVALMGNIHNQINEGSGRVGDLVLRALGPNQVISLNQLYGAGTAWVCLASEGCGAHKLGGRDGQTRGIILEPLNSFGEYHGGYGVGPINASLPAKGEAVRD